MANAFPDLVRSYKIQMCKVAYRFDCLCLFSAKELTPAMPPLHQFPTVRVEEGAFCLADCFLLFYLLIMIKQIADFGSICFS